jgi:2-keto-3-deoxy-L-fuconate dehydrogenase
MAGRLAGKRAVLTAAGQGIGRATALAFAREGATVIATDLDAAKLAGLAAAGAVTTFALDARDGAAIAALARAEAPIDVLFNCAGIVHHNTALTCTEAEWDLAFDLNVKSMHRTIQAFLPGMLKKGGGAIVNMASCASSVSAAANRYAYGATKAAVIGLTKSVAFDFIRDGIRCNAICPGTIFSPSLEERMAALGKTLPGGTEAARRMFVERQPMGRLGTAEEVAALAVYLASDEAKFTTGQIHIVDGGFSL